MEINEFHIAPEASWHPLTYSMGMTVRRCLVIHCTEGASAISSLNFMREKGLSVHFTIDRDGTIYQSVPCNRVAFHAGPKSRWVDPNTGRKWWNLNLCSIGIELANAGSSKGALLWALSNGGSAKSVNGTRWEAYPKAQIDSCGRLSSSLVKKYNLDDVVGHQNIRPEDKTDPGPLFPMENLRVLCGFAGLPVTHYS